MTYPWLWFPQLWAPGQVLQIVFISNERAFSLAAEHSGFFSLFSCRAVQPLLGDCSLPAQPAYQQATSPEWGQGDDS